MPRIRVLQWLVVAVACLVANNPSLATDQDGPRTVRRLARQADLVVMGTAHAAESSWDDSGRVIFTRTSFRIDRYFKGRGHAVLEVETLGGSVDGITMAVSHGATLEPGETVVLFLRRSRHGPQHVVWRGREGKLPVRAMQTGQRFIGRGRGVSEQTFADWVGGTDE